MLLGWPSSLIWASALIAMVLSIPLLWWSLFGDRQRGRRRCPRCWHDLTGTPGMTCGECGFSAASERMLHRSRRRLGLTALSISIMAASLGVVFWEVDRDWWLELVPSRVLIASMPWTSDSSNALVRELYSRQARGDLSPSQLQALLDRCFAGDSAALPVSPAWRRKYSQPILKYLRSSPEARLLDGRLLELPIDLSVTAPAQWPDDVPLCFNLVIEELWWPEWSDLRLTTRILDESEIELRDPLTICRRGGGAGAGIQSPLPIVVSPQSVGSRQFRVEVVVERRVSRGNHEWMAVETLDFSVPVQVAAGDPAAFTGVDTQELTDSMKQVFARGLMAWEGGIRPRRIRFDIRATSGEPWKGVAAGVIVEILRNGEVARTSRLWWTGGGYSASSAGGLSRNRPQLAWEPADERPELLKTLSDGDATWTMRVRGDRNIARRIDDSSMTSWWSGEFEVPLIVDVQKGTAPGPVWFLPSEDELVHPDVSTQPSRRRDRI
jgi:hypothetical protein